MFCAVLYRHVYDGAFYAQRHCFIFRRIRNIFSEVQKVADLVVIIFSWLIAQELRCVLFQKAKVTFAMPCQRGVVRNMARDVPTLIKVELRIGLLCYVSISLGHPSYVSMICLVH